MVTAKIAEHPHFRRRFGEEIRAAARFHHPRVVRVFDFGQLPDEELIDPDCGLRGRAPYLVMEWASGGTLRPQLGRMQWAEVKPLLLGILDALAALHAEYHPSGLKPDNVLLSQRGHY